MLYIMYLQQYSSYITTILNRNHLTISRATLFKEQTLLDILLNSLHQRQGVSLKSLRQKNTIVSRTF